MRGELDFTESFRARVGLLKGLPGELEAIAETLPLTEGAERLLAHSRPRHAGSCPEASASSPSGSPRGSASTSSMRAARGRRRRGHGARHGYGRRRRAEAELLTQIARDERITLDQVIAVGDGANDLPMLSLAGLGIAFRAKPLVRESAEQSISELGLDGILYLLGFTDEDQAGIG